MAINYGGSAPNYEATRSPERQRRDKKKFTLFDSQIKEKMSEIFYSPLSTDKNTKNLKIALDKKFIVSKIKN
jgi:hypothetical protein